MSLYTVFSPEFEVACDCVGGYCRYEQESWVVYVEAENRNIAKAKALKEFRRQGFDFDTAENPFSGMEIKSIDDWTEEAKLRIRNGPTEPCSDYINYWKNYYIK